MSNYFLDVFLLIPENSRHVWTLFNVVDVINTLIGISYCVLIGGSLNFQQKWHFLLTAIDALLSERLRPESFPLPSPWPAAPAVASTNL